MIYFGKTNVELRAWISNNIHIKPRNAMLIHALTSTNLHKPSLKLGIYLTSEAVPKADIKGMDK